MCEICRRQAVGAEAVRVRWCAETLAGEVVTAAGEDEEGRMSERGEEGNPGCQLISVVGYQEWAFLVVSGRRAGGCRSGGMGQE